MIRSCFGNSEQGNALKGALWRCLVKLARHPLTRIPLMLGITIAAALSACERQDCVNSDGQIVADELCDEAAQQPQGPTATDNFFGTPTSSWYFFHGGGYRPSYHMVYGGSVSTSSGGVRTISGGSHVSSLGGGHGGSGGHGFGGGHGGGHGGGG